MHYIARVKKILILLLTKLFKLFSELFKFIEMVLDASGEVVLEGFYENYSGDYSYVFEK